MRNTPLRARSTVLRQEGVPNVVLTMLDGDRRTLARTDGVPNDVPGPRLLAPPNPARVARPNIVVGKIEVARTGIWIVGVPNAPNVEPVADTTTWAVGTPNVVVSALVAPTVIELVAVGRPNAVDTAVGAATMGRGTGSRSAQGSPNVSVDGIDEAATVLLRLRAGVPNAVVGAIVAGFTMVSRTGVPNDVLGVYGPASTYPYSRGVPKVAVGPNDVAL